MPDSLCLTVLKKFADLFAEFLLIFLQILQFFRALGGGVSSLARPDPTRLKNCRICRLKSAEILQTFLKLSGTLCQALW